MKTVFMGTPDFAIPSLKVLKENTDLKLIFTKEDKVNARGKKILFSPVKQFALENEIECIQPTSLKKDEILDKIKEINPDLIVVVAYGKIIPKSIIDIPRLGIINVHSSILPKYRGASPIHSALINGDSETGISIMFINEGLDTGDVLEVLKTEILEEDNLGTLTDRLSKLGAQGLENTIPKLINNTYIATKQDDSKATLVKPIKKEEMQIDFDKTKEQIFNLVRGLSPSPCAYTIKNGEHIKIYSVQKLEKKYDLANGVVAELTKKGPVISCANGSILISSAKFEGKKLMTGQDIVNGRKLLVGDIIYDRK
ncbi:methionyl-tRNA formyltransferase [Caviibacter abscessus]|uniref:methionyl-tRNA formyltransferase n=1 Tax=Caviibacter abscessus TaxID=1766719 RepID=UPI00082E355E|nr:methionyl-tRNA formyltransferase [Caviibacter abscessus]